MGKIHPVLSRATAENVRSLISVRTGIALDRRLGGQRGANIPRLNILAARQKKERNIMHDLRLMLPADTFADAP